MKIKLIFFSKFEIPNIQLGAVRVFSGVAKLASKCDCSIAFNLPDVTFLISF